MKTWLKLLLFLIPALAGTLFVFWRMSPRQAVIRTAEVVFTSVEKKTLSTGTPREKAERFRQVLANEVEIKAPRPLPSDSISALTLASLLEDFHNGVSGCTISRENEEVAFSGENAAVYTAEIAADVAQGPSMKRHMRYRCRFEFERVDRQWRLRRIILDPI